MKKSAPSMYDKKVKPDMVKNFARSGTVFKRKIDPVVKSNPTREETHIFKQFGSVVTNGGSTALKENTFYTGDKVKGISLVHKSGFMPVFTDEQARDFANMRR